MKELEVANTDAWASALGNPNLEHFYSVLMTDVHKGKMSMETLVRTLSENPARILGVYPRKGVLLPGSDADLVVVDWNQERVLDNTGLYTKVGSSPWAGWKVKGVPVATVARGRIVAENGKVVGKPGNGQYLSGRPNPS
jgi:dihydroorotase-like cyclic amidohydrolase